MYTIIISVWNENNGKRGEKHWPWKFISHFSSCGDIHGKNDTNVMNANGLLQQLLKMWLLSFCSKVHADQLKVIASLSQTKVRHEQNSNTSMHIIRSQSTKGKSYEKFRKLLWDNVGNLLALISYKRKFNCL